MHGRGRHRPAAVAVGAMALAITLGLAVVARFAAQGRIVPGVRVAGVPVGGMTRTEAARALAVRLGAPNSGRVALEVAVAGRTYPLQLPLTASAAAVSGAVNRAHAAGRTGPPGRRLSETARALIGSYNVPIAATPNRAAVLAALYSLADQVAVSPQATEFNPLSGVMTAGRAGLALDTDGTATAILRAISLHRGDTLRVEGRTLAMPAPGPVAGPPTVAALPRYVVPNPRPQTPPLPARPVAASFETPILSNDDGRLQNIRRAARIIDGTKLPPGAVFSFNAVVGPREPSRGWVKARELFRGEFVLGHGGGICLVSSTLYNAVLLAGLQVLERTHHTRPLSYVPMVFWRGLFGRESSHLMQNS